MIDLHITFIPISAYSGENLIIDKKLDYYKGSSLISELLKI